MEDELLQPSLEVELTTDGEPIYVITTFSRDHTRLGKDGPFSEQGLRQHLADMGLSREDVDMWIARAWEKHASA